jgi:small subunit ribosomal protein S16
VAVKIRLKRMGKIRAPYYRIVVADARTRRDGRVIEEIGKYHPKADPSVIEVVSDRAQYWLGVGAQPTEAVAAILKVTGDWQKFKGEPGAEGTLRLAEPKTSKQDIFNEILKESHADLDSDAVTKKSSSKKAAGKPEETSAEDKPAEDKPAEDKPATTPKAKAAKAETKAEAPKADAEPTEEPAAPADEETTKAAVEATGGDAAVEDTPAAEATGASSEGTEEPAEAKTAEQTGSSEA